MLRRPSLNGPWLRIAAMSVVVSCAVALIAEWRLNKAWLASDVLRGDGFTEIDLGRYGWVECNWLTEPFATRFRAKNEAGKMVSGTVCSGWLLGSNVALD